MLDDARDVAGVGDLNGDRAEDRDGSRTEDLAAGPDESGDLSRWGRPEVGLATPALAWGLLAVLALPLAVLVAVAVRALTGHNGFLSDTGAGDQSTYTRVSAAVVGSGAWTDLLAPLAGLLVLGLLPGGGRWALPTAARRAAAGLAAAVAVVALAEVVLLGYLLLATAPSDGITFVPDSAKLDQLAGPLAGTLAVAALAVLAAGLLSRPVTPEVSLTAADQGRWEGEDEGEDDARADLSPADPARSDLFRREPDRPEADRGAPSPFAPVRAASDRAEPTPPAALRPEPTPRGAVRPDGPRPHDPWTQEARPGAVRPQESRPQESRPQEPRPEEARPAAARPQESQPQEPRPAAAEPVEPEDDPYARFRRPRS